MKLAGMMAMAGLVIALAIGCGGTRTPSTEDIEAMVREHIEQTWAAEPEMAAARITGFTLTHDKDNLYRGVLETAFNGTPLTFRLLVTWGGDNTFEGVPFRWQISN